MKSPNTLQVAPSILAGDHAHLRFSLEEAESVPGISWIHLDIMDGHFVPNLTFGPKTVADLRGGSKLVFDVHLMLDNPWAYIDAFAKAGANIITIHTEPAYPHESPLDQVLQDIRKRGIKAGLAINPGTPAADLEPYLEQIDLALLMTVQPGFGGQSFRSEVLSKIERIATLRDQHRLGFRIEVDGGINEETGKACIKAGTDTLVAGTAFYKSPDRLQFVRSLTTVA